MKNIIVCMKQVLDPEIPLSLFHVDSQLKLAIPPKATPPVLSPFDENALEAALKIKDTQESQVTVISLGKKLIKTVVNSALAAGADRLVLLQDESFGEFNTYLTASAIAAAIKKLGQYDLILCGLQAADTNNGQVGTGIACILGIPCITAARKMELEGNKIRVEKASIDGYEVIETPTPSVVTTTFEVGTLREPGVEAFMSAAQIEKIPDNYRVNVLTFRTTEKMMKASTEIGQAELACIVAPAYLAPGFIEEGNDEQWAKMKAEKPPDPTKIERSVPVY